MDDRVVLLLFCLELTLAGILVALLGGSLIAAGLGGVGFLLSFRAMAAASGQTADAVE